jgi:HSP20 family molecular chaperone IbpA
MMADQSLHLKTIEKEFFGIPLRAAPFFRREVLGLPPLREYAAALYDGYDPLARVDLPPPIKIESATDALVRVSLNMPYLESEKFEVYSKGGEVIVRYGNFKRSLMLPYTLLGRDVKRAEYADRRLLITFGPRVRAASVEEARAPEDVREDGVGEGADHGEEIGL